MNSFGSVQDRQSRIRNFAIIAHIDHGKSTLADRLLELTGTVAKREMVEQILDSNPIERERGITIKLAPVRMRYQMAEVKGQVSGVKNEQIVTHDTDSAYTLNLIDTPGHVDFSYEVSRSLAACEGAILVVDATQGVQAQTLANLRLARGHNLTIIPVINKIDLPNARVRETWQELAELNLAPRDVPSDFLMPSTPLTPICISAKTGQNVDKVLEAIIERIPPPHGEPAEPLRALIFSSQYDVHKGVVVFVRIVDGNIYCGAQVGTIFSRSATRNSLSLDTFFLDKLGKRTSKISYPPRTVNRESSALRFLASGAEITPIEIGYFSPKMIPCDILRSGEVGYIATGLKDVRLAKVGDTVTSIKSVKCQASGVRSQGSSVRYQVSGIKNEQIVTHDTLNHNTPIIPLPGYREPKPMVFVGLFPLISDEFTNARECMEKLRLSDSAFTFRPISSLALGNGFHCGFLGLLHAEIVQERLSREFNLNMIATAPSVEYHLKLKSGVNPSKAGFHFSSPTTYNLQPTTSYSIQSASEFPDPTIVEEVKEPIMSVSIFTPGKYVGAVMQLCQEKRGDYIDMKYLHSETTIQQFNNVTIGNQHDKKIERENTTCQFMVELEYLIPLSEMIIDFFDRLKSITEGYASLDYEFFDDQTVEVVKVDILVNKEKVDALSFLSVTDQARHRSIAIVEKLAEVIPRQQFAIPIQAAVGSPRFGEAGGQIIARADVKAFRKDVIQKLYGGDRTRKDKLLEAQKKGKTRMKQVGKVQIPQSAFFDVLKRS
jgi:GTP-binding protein LepA